MEGNFELNKSGFYEVQTAVENDFLNDKLTSDEYGKWYSVKFVGDAETYLWMTKTEPVPKEKYWGWVEKTSSGKSIKFKWDKKNAPNQSSEPNSTPGKKPDAFLRDATTVPIDMIRALLPYFDVQSLKAGSPQYHTLMELAKNLTEDALSMVENIRAGDKPIVSDEVYEDGDINLDNVEV